jgi:hypothetical protein
MNIETGRFFHENKNKNKLYKTVPSINRTVRWDFLYLTFSSNLSSWASDLYTKVFSPRYSELSWPSSDKNTVEFGLVLSTIPGWLQPRYEWQIFFYRQFCCRLLNILWSESSASDLLNENIADRWRRTRFPGCRWPPLPPDWGAAMPLR